MASGVRSVRAIHDPPPLSGMVVTQMKAPYGHVMHHPVFRLADNEGTTNIAKPGVNLETGFSGVCISNTFIHESDTATKAKRRRRNEQRMAVAVAGNITMPYIPMKDSIEPEPGNLVAFRCRRTRKLYRLLEGTEQQCPVICKYDPENCFDGMDKGSAPYKPNSCTAPFGVCVSVRPDEQQMTVLLRLDLYHTHAYQESQ